MQPTGSLFTYRIGEPVLCASDLKIVGFRVDSRLIRFFFGPCLRIFKADPTSLKENGASGSVPMIVFQACKADAGSESWTEGHWCPSPRSTTHRYSLALCHDARRTTHHLEKRSKQKTNDSLLLPLYFCTILPRKIGRLYVGLWLHCGGLHTRKAHKPRKCWAMPPQEALTNRLSKLLHRLSGPVTLACLWLGTLWHRLKVFYKCACGGIHGFIVFWVHISARDGTRSLQLTSSVPCG